ncbi:hypothetical protein BACT_0511 [Bifidobacterium actinocoloniiforme DSM 22766]|uniref:Uncharacterized protein n=1 Tax=Bifidobacterium actinocoloniiforme DSM 22766 TaxID=1437605 RepID=A0A086YZW1_9BIFI|nr:hypothetical protein [Bifidobacterium actinocoloniiforme]AKV55094.1 hypothetical protein AB656_01170 [Bifidobacterium actinocoloniiforme DSM 22766]KFI39811.1 hypothetical protein BACT_0511 [Bifidobacterium actinocoloniiforme DSM 22766]
MRRVGGCSRWFWTVWDLLFALCDMFTAGRYFQEGAWGRMAEALTLAALMLAALAGTWWLSAPRRYCLARFEDGDHVITIWRERP